MRRVQSNTLDVGIDVHLKNWSTAILSKHLAHASRGTISPYRTNGSAYGGFAIYMYLLIKMR